MKKLSNYLWWHKTNFDNYSANSNNFYAGVNLDQPFQNEGNINSTNNSKKGKRRLFLFASIITCCCLGIGLLGVLIYEIVNSNDGNSSTSSTNSGVSLEYNESSDATNWINKRTFSLLFSYYTYPSYSDYEKDINGTGYTTAGTGWIYFADESSNTFYIATNLHVASILSYANQTVTYYDEEDEEAKFVTETFSSISAYLGLSFDANESSNNYSNNIIYFPVSTPTVVYTTTTDADYNAVMNDSMNEKKYYGYSSTSDYPISGDSYIDKYYGASDIAIIKYTINPSTYSTSSKIFSNHYSSAIWLSSSDLTTTQRRSYITEFTQWISDYFDDPTVVYSDYMENLNISSSTKFYMAGYPSYDSSKGSQGSGLDDISWLSFSDFTIDSSIWGLTYSPGYSYSTGSSYTSPIAYYSSDSSDYTDYNYISIGILSLLKADSFAGASGSPIVMDVNGDGEYEIVGIYWGAMSFIGTGIQRGVMTWFDTNSYQLSTNQKVSYSITDGINTVLGISK